VERCGFLSEFLLSPTALLRVLTNYLQANYLPYTQLRRANVDAPFAAKHKSLTQPTLATPSSL
jgi:hypothetical protein